MLQRLFSSCPIIFCIKLYSYITILMLVRNTVCKILKRIQRLTSLTDQDSHMLTTQVCTKCSIFIDRNFDLNFHIHCLHCICKESLYCFNCLWLNLCKFSCFLRLFCRPLFLLLNHRSLFFYFCFYRLCNFFCFFFPDFFNRCKRFFLNNFWF